MSQLGKSSGTGGPPVRLGDIAKARMGKTILSKELIGAGVPVYSAGRDNEPWGYVPTSDLLFGEETIVIAARGNIGFPRVPRITPFVSTQTTIAISFKDSRHVPYLRYQLETVNWPGMTSQTTIPMVTVRQVEGIEVRLPHLDEQRRIVAEIEKQFTRLEAGVAALRRVQANLKSYRAAVLKAACEGRLVPTEAELQKLEGRGQKSKAKFETGAELLARILTERRQNWQGRGNYKEPAAPDTANLPPLPDGWTWTNLDSAIISGPQNGVYLPRELYGSGHAILRIDDYQDGWVRGIDELNKVAADAATATKYQLLPGDLVINRVNSLTHLGKCLVVRETHAHALFESNMMKGQLAACVNPRYVEFYLRSRDGRTRLISGAKWAVNQASINQEDVKRTPLPLPPLAEQTRIVAEVERRLSVVEELESVVTANLQRASRLRQSILQKAFTGGLVS
jgi:type I restriction enzyme S subunit